MPRGSLSAGVRSELSWTVDEADTAASVGSGELAVLGTPRLLAWMERTTCAALAEHLGDGEASVGTRMTIDHLKATPVGHVVTVVATVAHVDGRLVRFGVVATQVGAVHTDGVLVAQAEITRIIVDRSRFLVRLS